MHKLIRILAIISFASMLSACNYRTDTSSTDSTSTHAPQTASTSSDSINLSWKAPSTRADGTYLPVGELAGYRVYMGTSSDNLTELVDLDDYSITQYTVNDLTAGDHYFSITSYDTEGVESSFSPIILVRST